MNITCFIICITYIYNFEMTNLNLAKMHNLKIFRIYVTCSWFHSFSYSPSLAFSLPAEYLLFVYKLLCTGQVFWSTDNIVLLLGKDKEFLQQTWRISDLWEEQQRYH